MSGAGARIATRIYLLLFFAYLLLPLLVMGLPAFNTSSYPRVLPFDGFTMEWFGALMGDEAMLYGLRNSLWIGALVVIVSVPLGLAGAVLLNQVRPRLRPLLYVATVAPVLVPGVIIGISTVIFWRELTLWAGNRTLYNGVLLTVLGQSSFISAYCMLLFSARLHRFDRALEEAAYDLGASHTQVFCQILLPFLRPAILSAAALAFLSSFENYNTTTFAILSDRTLTTVLAGQVRQGTTPAVSALAVLTLTVTVAVLLAVELVRRWSAGRRRARARTTIPSPGTASALDAPDLPGLAAAER